MLKLSARIRTEGQEKAAAWPKVYFYIMEKEASTLSYTWLYYNGIIQRAFSERMARPDHGLTNDLENAILFFQAFLLKNHLLGAYH